MFPRGSSGADVAAVVSVHGRREFGVEADVPRRLDLAFDDADVPVPGDVTALHLSLVRRRWREQNGLIEVPPGPADAAAIIAFAEAIRTTEGIVLCHCGAGMSRAPAAALVCLSVWKGAGTEDACVREIFRLRRGAVPHVGLVRFADDLLGRDGKLVGALVAARQNREEPESGLPGDVRRGRIP